MSRIYHLLYDVQVNHVHYIQHALHISSPFAYMNDVGKKNPSSHRVNDDIRITYWQHFVA